MGRRSIESVAYDCVVIVVEASASGSLSRQHQQLGTACGRVVSIVRILRQRLLAFERDDGDFSDR